MTWLALCIAFNAAALSLVFEDLPVCVFPMVNGLGIIPQNSLPTLWWQIAFYPLEALTLLLPMLVTGLNSHTIIAGLEAIRCYSDELRFVNAQGEPVNVILKGLNFDVDLCIEGKLNWPTFKVGLRVCTCTNA